ncbi:hypothetical protein H0H92_009774 [Tricholoma furcatifolium]|nr:hypothetical protein H0H92_009774 [Tricholoma furcatifolium]
MFKIFELYKADILAATLEFVGTTFFLLLGLGGVQASSGERLALMKRDPGSDVEQVLYISLCMGFSLLVSAWLFFRITGGLFNPNVSLALLLVKAMKPVRFCLFCIAQFAGAIAASALIRGLTSEPLFVGRSERRSRTFLQQGISVTQGVFIEMFITCALVLSVLMLAAEKHQATAFAPFCGVLHWRFNELREIIWAGSSSAFYATMKHIEYEKLNPGQDATDPLAAAQEMEKANS